MAVETLAPKVEERIGLPGGAILPPWVEEPYRLWSLPEMLEFKYSRFADHVSWFRSKVEKARKAAAEKQEITDKDREEIIKRLFEIHGDRESLGIIDESASHYWISHTCRVFGSSWESIAESLVDLQVDLNQTLSRHRFAFIPRPEYFEQCQRPFSTPRNGVCTRVSERWRSPLLGGN